MLHWTRKSRLCAILKHFRRRPSEESSFDNAVVGVIGTGLMGLGIATQSALYVYRTIVHDVDAGRLASVASKAEAVLDELIDAGRIDATAKRAAVARIETHVRLETMAAAQLTHKIPRQPSLPI